MTISFGIETMPQSAKWDDVRKGPSGEAVLQHLRKVVHYRDVQAQGRG